MESLSPNRSIARYIAALFNRCPDWLASLHEGLPAVQVVARSPSGAAYAFSLQLEGVVEKPAVEELLEALVPGQRGVMVCKSGKYTSEALALAKEHKVLAWSLGQLDYLLMAAELEMNAPLAYVGLEVEPHRALVPDQPSNVTGVFYV